MSLSFLHCSVEVEGAGAVVNEGKRTINGTNCSAGYSAALAAAITSYVAAASVLDLPVVVCTSTMSSFLRQRIDRFTVRGGIRVLHGGAPAGEEE